MEKKHTTSDVRQRILETADRLFYQHGLRAVGIDRIIAEADVAKMSLYKHFPSKDELILAVLKYREVQIQEFFGAAMHQHEKRMKSKLRAFFAALKDWSMSPGFRGCAFQNARVELADPNHPGTQFVREHKQRFQTFITGIIEESLGKGSAKAAPAINLLVEGVVVTSVIEGSPHALDVARDAALKMVENEKIV